MLTTYCLLLTAHCSLLTAHCLLLTAHCSLLTAYCLLLTAYCLLLTAYCLLVFALSQLVHNWFTISQRDPADGKAVLLVISQANAHDAAAVGLGEGLMAAEVSAGSRSV